MILISALPNPSAHTVLCTESLVHQSLFVERLLQFFISNASLYLVLNKLQSAIHIVNIDLLVEQLTEIGNRHLQE